jgi:hypothetical protein
MRYFSSVRYDNPIKRGAAGVSSLAGCPAVLRFAPVEPSPTGRKNALRRLEDAMKLAIAALDPLEHE